MGTTRHLAFAAIAIATMATADAAEDRIVVPFVEVSGAASTLLIQVLINGHATHLLIDTGADTSVLRKADLAKLGLQGVGSHTRTIVGVNGADTRKADVLAVPFLEIGNARFWNVSLTGWDLPRLQNTIDASGLLGRDFLVPHGAVIDMRQRTISFQRPPQPDATTADTAQNMIGIWHGLLAGSPVDLLVDGRTLAVIGGPYAGRRQPYRIEGRAVYFLMLNEPQQRTIVFESNDKMVWTNPRTGYASTYVRTGQTENATPIE